MPVSQQQRVWIAMTLAQGASYLLLDEPTSHLDTCHQLEIMELLTRLNRDENKTVVMVLHDLNLAARYAHHIIALKAGRIVTEGTPESVMTEATLAEVLGISAHIFRDPRTGAPMCIPYMASEPLGSATVTRTVITSWRPWDTRAIWSRRNWWCCC